MRSREVPESLEGWATLHQMVKVDWTRLGGADVKAIAAEAAAHFSDLEGRDHGQSALFSLLGHKGDLMLLHWRETFDELNAAELALTKLKLWEYIEVSHSYLSIIELGLYGDTLRLRAELDEKKIEAGSQEWNDAFNEMLAAKREENMHRLFPKVPERRYLCFYPMDKKRGESKNWYSTPMTDRGRMMRDHGMIGRTYAGRVQQFITGSIGFDDWEWGVDLFAADPVVFKKLVYEMRFDEASSDYGLFGQFFLGLRFAAEDFGKWLDRELPELS